MENYTPVILNLRTKIKLKIKIYQNKDFSSKENDNSLISLNNALSKEDIF